MDILHILSNIRTSISNEIITKPNNFIRMIQHDYPIIELIDRQYHGVTTYSTYPYKIKHIAICLYANNNDMLPIEIIIATFLHELAHTVTDTNDTNDHSISFYQNFGIILRCAERLNIYAISNMRDKYSVRSLIRFDNIDIDALLNSMNIGHSVLYSPKKKNYVILIKDGTINKTINVIEYDTIKTILTKIEKKIKRKISGIIHQNKIINDVAELTQGGTYLCI